jgi:hypothetical protein
MIIFAVLKSCQRCYDLLSIILIEGDHDEGEL